MSELTIKEILFSQAAFNIFLLLVFLGLLLFAYQFYQYNTALKQIMNDLDLKAELEFTELCKLCIVLHDIGKIE